MASPMPIILNLDLLLDLTAVLTSLRNNLHQPVWNILAKRHWGKLTWHLSFPPQKEDAICMMKALPDFPPKEKENMKKGGKVQDHLMIHRPILIKASPGNKNIF